MVWLGSSKRRSPTVAKLGQHPWAREYLWRPSAVTFAKYRELQQMAEGLNQEDESAIALRDEMRCLPDFPAEAELWDVVTVIIPKPAPYSFSTRKAN